MLRVNAPPIIHHVMGMYKECVAYRYGSIYEYL
jgi:hypothetical protein